MIGKIPDDQKYTWAEIYEKIKARLPKKASHPDFKPWFMSNEKNGKLFDYKLIARAFTMFQDMKNKDKDHFTLLCGKEGSGKSTMAIQLASWVDPNFTHENVCFTPQQYLKRLKEVERGSCLIMDEGGVALYSREALSFDNISMTKLFMLQRQKNVSCIVCCPSFYDIDSYIRKHRINTLIRVTKQGGYCGYLQKAINIINEIGYAKKPLTHIKCPNGTFWHGYFRKTFPKATDRQKYLQEKKKHLTEYMNSLEMDFGQPKMILASKVAAQLGLKAGQMDKRLQKGTIKGKKIGAKWFISWAEYEKLLDI